ncbi:MAG TPA: FAD:protein FMN transferase [Gammaproteobacteria bacterium]|nr:FAD:protein FMN transferase [Gammaproteobacteria bacterium]
MKRVIVAVLLLVLGCTEKATEKPVFEDQMFVMGTMVSVSIYGESETKSRAVFDQLSAKFQTMHHAWSPHENGALYGLNELLPTQTPVPIDSTLADMIETSSQLSSQSEGMFNPAMGQLIALWGFSQDGLSKGPPPPRAQINALLLSNPQMSDLTLTDSRVLSRNPAVALNFGAFAKGYAVDSGIEYLKSAGIKNAIINAGGDLRVLGSKGAKPWLIGIRHPREAGVLAGIEVKDNESVFTSGDYERYYDYQGKRYHHIIDPRTGFPADETISVTVVNENAALADAAATALFVAGPTDWERIAKKMLVDQVMLIDKKSKIYLTPKIYKRLIFTHPEALDMTISTEFRE